MVDLRQESVGVDTVDHASLFYGLAAGGRAAQAVHADCHEGAVCGAMSRTSPMMVDFSIFTAMIVASYPSL